MTLPDWTRPGEKRAHTVALVLAMALPLVVHAAADWRAVGGAPLLWLTVPIVAVAWLGGAGPGLLATAVALIGPLVWWARGAPIDHHAVLALAAFGVVVSAAFEATLRSARKTAAWRHELQQQSAFYAAAAESAADFAWSARFAGERLLIDHATTGFIAAIGATPEEINGRGGLAALVDPDDVAVFTSACERLAQGQPAAGELRGVASGRPVRYRYDMRPVREGDTTVGAIGTMRDVTAQHELVQQLSEWKERYEATVMATGLLLYDYDTVADRLIIGGDAQRMLGEWASQLAGPLAGWLRRLHPDDVQRFVAAHQAALQDGHDLRVEYRVRHQEGRYVTVEHSGRLADEGESLRMIGFLRDVTEERRAIEQLQEQERQQQASAIEIAGLQATVQRMSAEFGWLVALAPVGVAVATPGVGGSWLANEALARLLGRPRLSSEPLAPLAAGPEPRVVAHGRELSDDELPMQRVARDGQATMGEELVLSFPDGRTAIVLAGAAPVIDGGQLASVIGVFADVSELRRLETELQRRAAELGSVDQRKDEFLATLAHELRNPLAPIRNASMLLGLQEGSPQGIDWIRRVIDRQTDHLARLIDDLLDVSRITRNKLTLRLERIALDRVIEAAVEAVRSQIEAQRHQLNVDVQSGVWLQGDQVRLVQIFANLLSNAIKYTSPGGALRIRGGIDDDGMVAVAVRDNGIGIPPEQLPNVFEMFYQVDRSIERAHAGLGIGLTLVDRLVRLHGGQVSAFSEGIGRGAEFVVRLPVADQPTRSEPRPTSTPRGVRGLRILVADDSVDSALTLTALLAAAGHEVQAVHDGFAALQRAAEKRPHVMVLDIGKPGLNGYDTCRRIRAEPWGRNAVIIAVTGWGTDEDRRRSREAGFDAHLVKPVDYTELQKHFSLDNIAL